MPSVSPISKSLVAKYLTANRARSVRQGDVCHFLSPEGAYLGFQKKQDIGGVKFFTTSIVDGNFQPMYSKSVVIANHIEYVSDKNFKLGVSPVVISMAKKVFFLDYFKNVYSVLHTEHVLKNRMNLVAIDESSKVGLFRIERPYEYTGTCVSSKEDVPFSSDIKKSKFIYN